MAGALAGVTRSPLTAVVFALDLTHDANTLLPLLLVSTIAHLLSVLVLKRSILTEKVARRGFHVLREYAVGPMEVLFVRDVMATDVLTIESGSRVATVHEMLLDRSVMRGQRLLPVLSADGTLAGVVPWADILERAARGESGNVEDLMRPEVVVAYPDEALRDVADRMAERRLGVLPVGGSRRPRSLAGDHHPVRPAPGQGTDPPGGAASGTGAAHTGRSPASASRAPADHPGLGQLDPSANPRTSSSIWRLD